MKKLITLVLFIAGLELAAQTDLTFYHMGSATPQSSIMNASFFPDANWYVQVPGMSTYTRANTGISYNEIFTQDPNSDSVRVDLNSISSALKPGSRLSFDGAVSLLQFGFRARKRTFSYFWNYRAQASSDYPVEFIGLLAGNSSLSGTAIEENNLKGGGMAYWEMGLGYSQETSLAGKPLIVGGRVKMLNGLVFAGTEKNASISVQSSAESLSMQWQNASILSAGLNEISGDDAESYFFNSGNRGFAVDLGAQYELNEKFRVALAINDLGSITWKNDQEENRLLGTGFTFSGLVGLDTLDIGQALADSADIWFETEEVSTSSFTTSVGPNIFVSGSYLPYDGGTVTGTVGMLNNYSTGSTFIFGAGYTQQVSDVLYASTTVSKRGQESFAWGLGMALRILGSVQFHASVDNLSGILQNASDFQGTDFRFGMNVMIGGKRRSEIKDYRRARKAEKKGRKLSDDQNESTEETQF